MIKLSRGAVLQGYREVVEELGIDARAVVMEAGLPAGCLDEPDIKIRTEAAFWLLELTARRFGISDLGLRMAEKRRFSTLGIIGLVMRAQPDAGSALRFMADHFWSHAEGISMDFETSDGLVLLVPILEHGPDTRVIQATELCAAVVCNLLRRFIGRDYCPEMVCFSHDRTAPRARYKLIFGDTVVFGQERTLLAVRAEDLAVAIPDADPVVARDLERYLTFVEGADAGDLVTKVHDMIRQLLPNGACQIKPVAARLGISRRTLHRHLAARDTNFEALVQQVRIELARGHLAVGNHSMTEISEMLGFSHLSGFSRWRRRWLVDSASRSGTGVKRAPPDSR